MKEEYGKMNFKSRHELDFQNGLILKKRVVLSLRNKYFSKIKITVIYSSTTK